MGEQHPEEPRDTAERRLSTLVDTIPGFVFRCHDDPPWHMEYVSAGCTEVTGYDAAALENGDVVWGDDIVHPADRERVNVADVFPDQEYTDTYRILTADGETRWVWESARTVEGPNGEDLVEGYIVDATERVERERELDRKSSLLDSIFESVPVHLYVKDEEARHVRVSDRFGQFREFEGKTDVDLEGETEHALRSYEDDIRVIETGEPVLNKEEYVSGDDRWNLTSKVPWRDEDGDVVGLIGISWDITERKRSQQAIRRQKERLDEFASVVSHDLRNPLGVAKGYLELAREGDEEAFDRVEAALDRIDEMVDDLQAIARGESVADGVEWVDLAQMVEAAWRTAATASADLTVADDLGEIRVEESRVRHLLENLFRNSVEHGSTGPRSRAHEDSVEHGSTGPRSRAHEDSGEHGSTDDRGVSVTVGRLPDGFYVADDGPGIPEADRETVFERGYTTDDRGTGFGLVVVRDVAEAHGWSVDVAESASGGARFEFSGVECRESAN